MEKWIEEKIKIERDPTRERDLARCGDCHVIEGEYHLDGCDMEDCSICGGQRITCGCSNNPQVPFIAYPYFCARCGKKYPELFQVDKEEWNHYIIPNMRKEVICWDCYQKIKRLIDKAEEK